MRTQLSLLLLIFIALSACKWRSNGGCSTGERAAAFDPAGVLFDNKDGSRANVGKVEMINLRTNKPVKKVESPFDVDYQPGFVLIATDETKSEFSTEGDDVKVTAKNTKTGQVKSVVVKISGGSNCHAERISGPDKVVFD